MILCCQCLICVAVLLVRICLSRLNFVVFLRLEFGGLFMIPLVHVTAAVLTIFCACYFSIFSCWLIPESMSDAASNYCGLFNLLRHK